MIRPRKVPPEIALLALALGGWVAHAGGPAQIQKPDTKPAAASVLVEDKGKFRVLLDGHPAGTEEFQISPNGSEWLARGSTEISAPNRGSTRVSAKLKLGPDGTPVQYEWSSQGPKKASATVAFQGGTATMELHLEGATPFTQQFLFPSPRVVILDNNLYHHYAILARLYDWETKGAQTFSVLIPQDLTPGTITVEAAGSEEIEGQKLERLRVHSADLEINLYLDGRRLVRIEVPSSKAVVIRE